MQLPYYCKTPKIKIKIFFCRHLYQFQQCTFKTQLHFMYNIKKGKKNYKSNSSTDPFLI